MFVRTRALALLAAGAKVTGGGDSCTTKANGTCTLSVTPKKAGKK